MYIYICKWPAGDKTTKQLRASQNHGGGITASGSTTFAQFPPLPKTTSSSLILSSFPTLTAATDHTKASRSRIDDDAHGSHRMHKTPELATVKPLNTALVAVCVHRDIAKRREDRKDKGRQSRGEGVRTCNCVYTTPHHNPTLSFFPLNL